MIGNQQGNNRWPAEIGARQCPRCRSEEFTILFVGFDRLYRTTQREFHVVECTRCGLMQLAPRPSAAELADLYPERYWWAPDGTATGRLEDVYRRAVLGDHLRFVWPGVENRGPLLDVGCGGGSFPAALGRRGVRALGLEWSERAAAVAWRHNSVPAVCGRLDAAPFTPESFGVITMFHVLEHLGEPQTIVRAAHRLLRADGRLYAQVPNADCWQFLLLGERWSGLDVPRHLIHFRAEDLEDLLDGCGFRVLRRKFFSLRDNPAGLATSLAPQWEPMSRRARAVRETAAGRLLRNLLHLAAATAALPFAAMEAAAGAGSTILVEAAKK